MLGSNKVSDEALLKANDTIRKMFAYRHDILKALISDGARLVVLGRDEALGELPEFQEIEARRRASTRFATSITPHRSSSWSSPRRMCSVYRPTDSRASAWW